MVQAAWLEAKTPHFIIYSEQRQDALAKYADQLERFDQAVRPFFRLDDQALSDGSKLRIYVMRDQAAVAALAGGSNFAGFYVTRASGSRAWVHRDAADTEAELGPTAIFQHEYVHHLMLQSSNAALPMWVTEAWPNCSGQRR